MLILHKRPKVAIIIFGFLLIGGAIYSSSHQTATPIDIIVPVEITAAVPAAEPARTALPLRLKIPKINVDAPIDHVALTANGAMEVPKDPANVAWFSLGTPPGGSGSAVMAGHFGWINNTPAVFDKLHKLRPGDTLLVENDEGVSTTFVVRESRSYNPNADASEVFLLNDGVAHLNLVTCEGVWSKVSNSYSRRLVVFTDKQ